MIVVIGTPVDEFLGPSMTVFERAVDQIAPHLATVRSSSSGARSIPGTTEYVTQALADRGCRVDVAFCPERIAEGHALEELRSLPQIIGADSTDRRRPCRRAVREPRRSDVRTTTREAELAKLFTNTWRYMKFAVANQFLMIAQQAGIDYTNVLRAIREDYPRAADLPGPGFAAGPCLFKDTMQLAAFTTDHFPMGQAAMQVNEGLPAYVVTAMERRYGPLARADGRHPRHGLQGRIGRHARLALLQAPQAPPWAGATRPLRRDPYVNDERLLPLDDVLARSEILVIGAPHRAYRSLDLVGRDVVDIWDVSATGSSS